MANTYTLISSISASGSPSTLTFSSIPSTYTDLVLLGSSRMDANGSNNAYFSVKINNDATTSIYTSTYLESYGVGSPISARSTNGINQMYPNITNGSTSTTNVWGFFELYLPSYTSSIAKQASIISIREENTTDNQQEILAQRLNYTSSINRIDLISGGGTWRTNSNFYLYGIKNS